MSPKENHDTTEAESQQVYFCNHASKHYFVFVDQARKDALGENPSDDELLGCLIQDDVYVASGKRFLTDERPSTADLASMLSSLMSKDAADKASSHAVDNQSADNSADAASDEEPKHRKKNEANDAKIYILKHGKVEKIHSAGHGEKNNSKNDSMGSRAIGR